MYMYYDWNISIMAVLRVWESQLMTSKFTLSNIVLAAKKHWLGFFPLFFIKKQDLLSSKCYSVEHLSPWYWLIESSHILSWPPGGQR